MIDTMILMKLIDAYRATAKALGVIADRFDGHATVLMTASEGLGAMGRGYSIDLLAHKNRLDALAEDLLDLIQKKTLLAKARR